MPTDVSNVSYAKLGYHWEKMSWEVWRRNCNALMVYWTGKGMFGLPKAMPWKRWFESGLCVCVAVHEALWTCGIMAEDLLDDFEREGDRYVQHDTNKLGPTWEGELDSRPRVPG